MILAICLQESGFRSRRQIARYENVKPVYGPARGYGQFEMGGGIIGVLRHSATKAEIRAVLKELNYDDDTVTSYFKIEDNDVLCAAYCRLLLWTDPKPLPAIGDIGDSWEYYLRCWRPGKPHPETWGGYYDEARRAV